MMPVDDSDPPNSDDFRKCLDAVLNDARRSGRPYVDVRAKELHKMVGGYPNKGNHRMPVCCGVMINRMRKGDKILSSPPNVYGATLCIRYNLD